MNENHSHKMKQKPCPNPDCRGERAFVIPSRSAKITQCPDCGYRAPTAEWNREPESKVEAQTISGVALTTDQARHVLEKLGVRSLDGGMVSDEQVTLVFGIMLDMMFTAYMATQDMLGQLVFAHSQVNEYLSQAGLEIAPEPDDDDERN